MTYFEYCGSNNFPILSRFIYALNMAMKVHICMCYGSTVDPRYIDICYNEQSSLANTTFLSLNKTHTRKNRRKVCTDDSVNNFPIP